MKFYFAPLEGITGYLYRNAHYKFFDRADKYFAPFIGTNQNGIRKTKEIRDILPENNPEIPLVPQLLSNKSGDFITYAKKIQQLGYKEINLNLGCPSRTVAAKKKGAGFLAFPEELDRFLEEIFEGVSADISIKTRIGMDQPEEFAGLLDIYNRYPLKELIIHPRTQKDYYNGKPDLEMFRYGLENSKNPVCYNGDIFTKEDYERFRKEFPQTDRVMLGRGLLKNPGLIGELKGGERTGTDRLKAFHDELYEKYRENFSGETPVLFKMKELWVYLSGEFPDCEKTMKKIKKAQRLRDYEGYVYELFEKRRSIYE